MSSSTQITPDKELNEILGRIQVAVHKYGIRTTEFFCDHDKLRSGVITKNQFVCGLMLCIKERVTLTKGEVQKIVDYYVNPDDRVRYMDFCHTMENGKKMVTRGINRWGSWGKGLSSE